MENYNEIISEKRAFLMDTITQFYVEELHKAFTQLTDEELLELLNFMTSN